MPVVSDYTALLSGSYWGGIEVIAKPVIITYSFPVFAPAYDQAVVGNTAFSTFSSFTAGEKTQAQNALSQWSAASGITFVQVEPGSGDINFGLFDFSAGGEQAS